MLHTYLVFRVFRNAILQNLVVLRNFPADCFQSVLNRLSSLIHADFQERGSTSEIR